MRFPRFRGIWPTTNQSLPTVGENKESDETGEDPDRPLFSLVTGKYRQPKLYGHRQGDASSPQSDGPSSTSLTVRNNEDSLIALPDSAAGALAVPFFNSYAHCAL